MKTPTILINIFYSEITPDSAEQGDFSDTGIVLVNEPVTFSELFRLVRSSGFAKETNRSDWLSTGYYVNDYKTLTERQETLHFSRDNDSRLKKWFDLAVKGAVR